MRMPPDVVGAQHGFGHRALGQVAKGRGSAFSDLNTIRYDPLAGGARHTGGAGPGGGGPPPAPPPPPPPDTPPAGAPADHFPDRNRPRPPCRLRSARAPALVG